MEHGLARLELEPLSLEGLSLCGYSLNLGGGESPWRSAEVTTTCLFTRTYLVFQTGPGAGTILALFVSLR